MAQKPNSVKNRDMSIAFWTGISKLCRMLLSLRYRVRIKGLEKLRASKLDRGILFLPNHPAHLDPLFLFLLLWPRYRMRPVVVEYIYRLPLLKFLMKLVRALPIPNLDTSINQLKIQKASAAIQEIADGLKRGENFVVHPAGRLKSSGKEVIGGASGAHALAQECPDAHIVLIRTTGLWGSSFSRALLGRSPDLAQTLMTGIKILLKNGLFFAPRRQIEIEIAFNLPDLPRSGTRLAFNRYLENWFNRYPNGQGKIVDTEPVQLVSYSRWREEFPAVFQPKAKKRGEGIEVSDDTSAKVYTEIRRILKNPGIKIGPEMNLAIDLGMDSLNIADLAAYLTKNYEVEEIHPEDIETVQNVLEMAEGSRSSEHFVHQMNGAHWPEEKNRPMPIAPEGKTLPEAFLKACERMRGYAAAADDLIGVLSYQKMKRIAIVLSLYFQNLPDSRIAVMLPATAGSYLVILAILFAGKTPVMLNWTLGKRYLDDMMRTSGAKRVISSWRFLDRLSHVEFGELSDSIELLEDIRQQLPLRHKLKGLILSFFPASAVSRSLKIDGIDENAHAVILFTSGTEASPKGVPLTHKNILSNQCSAMQCINFNEKDVLYGILPPFHSFGFSVAGLFPLCAGIKVAFYPDPTDGAALAEGVQRWKVTLFCSAPSFLKGLFAVAKDEQLKTIRFFICGAEKTPPELFERVEKLGTKARVIEGYGITECAPILTLTRINQPHLGVGQFLPDIEVCMIHPETLELLSEGEEGEICVRGPNVFSGYLGTARDPFIEIAGKRWYRTGDIGHLDPDRNLILSGRLKRFTKLGGEMISLGAIEEVLIQALISQGKISGDLPSLALIADEREQGKPQLIVFSTIFLDTEEVNGILREAGFSRLAKISDVRKIEEIPLMGTGKTDYRRLQSYVVETV